MPSRSPNPTATQLVAPDRIRSVADLKRLQSVMTATLFRPLTEDEGMLETSTDGRPTEEVVSTFITPNDRLTSFERLEIYNRVYWFRILQALSDDFPVLRALLGEKRFDRLSQAFLEAHPSASWTLRNLGSRLPSFIESEPQWTRPKTAMALDVARMEWAEILAFDEEARSPVKGDELLGTPPDQLRLALQPHLILLELQYAADDFLHQVKSEDDGLRSEASNVTAHSRKSTQEKSGAKRAKLPKLRKEPVWLALHRSDNMVYYKRLEREAFRVLSALRDGSTLLEALDHGLAEADPQVDWAAKIQGWFSHWAQLGWLCHRV